MSDAIRLTLFYVASLAAVAMVYLALDGRQPCNSPETVKLGGSTIAELCGTERKREAVNEGEGGE